MPSIPQPRPRSSLSRSSSPTSVRAQSRISLDHPRSAKVPPARAVGYGRRQLDDTTLVQGGDNRDDIARAVRLDATIQGPSPSSAASPHAYRPRLSSNTDQCGPAAQADARERHLKATRTTAETDRSSSLQRSLRPTSQWSQPSETDCRTRTTMCGKRRLSRSSRPVSSKWSIAAEGVRGFADPAYGLACLRDRQSVTLQPLERRRANKSCGPSLPSSASSPERGCSPARRRRRYEAEGSWVWLPSRECH